MSKSPEDVVKEELREVIETALDNGLLLLLDSSNLHTYKNGSGTPKNIEHWATLFSREENHQKLINEGYALSEDKLKLTFTFLQEKGYLQSDHKRKEGWTLLLAEFCKQQGKDLGIYLKAELKGEGPSGFSVDLRKKSIFKRDEFTTSLAASLKNVQLFIKQPGPKPTEHDPRVIGATQQYNHALVLLQTQGFEYGNRASGLGIISESLSVATSFLFNLSWEISSSAAILTTGVVKSVAVLVIQPALLIGAWAMLAQMLGTPAYESPTRQPDEYDRPLGSTYMYAWWLFDSLDDYREIEQSMRWPRHREEDRQNYREAGRKEETLNVLLSSSKGSGRVQGRFLGAMDFSDRNQIFEDRVRCPPLREGQIIALGCTPAKLFDMATKEFRMASFWHSVRRQDGSHRINGIRDIPNWLREMVKEGKIRYDVTNLKWHWTHWDGQLDIDYGSIHGRVVDFSSAEGVLKSFTNNTHKTLPCSSDDEATHLMQEKHAIGLAHTVEVHLDYGNGKGMELKTEADKNGFFTVENIPLNVPFVVKSPSKKPHKQGKHEDGWQTLPQMVLTRDKSKIINSIVPKEVAEDKEPVFLVYPGFSNHVNKNGHTTSCNAPYGMSGSQKEGSYPQAPQEPALPTLSADQTTAAPLCFTYEEKGYFSSKQNMCSITFVLAHKTKNSSFTLGDAGIVSAEKFSVGDVDYNHYVFNQTSAHVNLHAPKIKTITPKVNVSSVPEELLIFRLFVVVTHSSIMLDQTHMQSVLAASMQAKSLADVDAALASQVLDFNYIDFFVPGKKDSPLVRGMLGAPKLAGLLTEGKYPPGKVNAVVEDLLNRIGYVCSDGAVRLFSTLYDESSQLYKDEQIAEQELQHLDNKKPFLVAKQLHAIAAHLESEILKDIHKNDTQSFSQIERYGSYISTLIKDISTFTKDYPDSEATPHFRQILPLLRYLVDKTNIPALAAEDVVEGVGILPSLLKGIKDIESVFYSDKKSSASFLNKIVGQTKSSYTEENKTFKDFVEDLSRIEKEIGSKDKKLTLEENELAGVLSLFKKRIERIATELKSLNHCLLLLKKHHTQLKSSFVQN